MYLLQGSLENFISTSNCLKSHWKTTIRKITINDNDNNTVAPWSLSNYQCPILKVLYEYIWKNWVHIYRLYYPGPQCSICLPQIWIFWLNGIRFSLTDHCNREDRVLSQISLQLWGQTSYTSHKHNEQLKACGKVLQTCMAWSFLEPMAGFSIALNQSLGFGREVIGGKVGGVLWVANRVHYKLSHVQKFMFHLYTNMSFDCWCF